MVSEVWNECWELEHWKKPCNTENQSCHAGISNDCFWPCALSYPSESSNLCRASRTISSVTSGLRMSLICSGKKSNMSTRNQQLLLHSVGRQRSLTHSSNQQRSLEGCGEKRSMAEGPRHNWHLTGNESRIQISFIYGKRIAHDSAGRNHSEKLCSKRANGGSPPTVQDVDKDMSLLSVQHMTFTFSLLHKMHCTLMQCQI